MVKTNSLMKKIESFDKLASNDELTKNANLLNKINNFYKIAQMADAQLFDSLKALIEQAVKFCDNRKLTNSKVFFNDRLTNIINKKNDLNSLKDEVVYIINGISSAGTTFGIEEPKIDKVGITTPILTKANELLKNISSSVVAGPAITNKTKPSEPTRYIKPVDYNKDTELVNLVRGATEWLKDSGVEKLIKLYNSIDANLKSNGSADKLFNNLKLVKTFSENADSTKLSVVANAMKYIEDRYGPNSKSFDATKSYAIPVKESDNPY